jgi:hypothetical protein
LPLPLWDTNVGKPCEGYLQTSYNIQQFQQRSIMHGRLKLKFFASILVLSPITFAQKPVEPANQVAMGAAQPPKSMEKVAADKVVAKKSKLTPDQVMGNQILESAESQARGLEASMRSYSLLQIAAAFAASDPAKARGLLQDAFSASLAIPDDSFTRDFLQQDIFRMLLPISQSDVEERLTQAESRARRQASDSIIARYAEKEQFDKAIDLVQQVTSLDEFPYPAADRLLGSLSPEMNAEKQTLFASAIASYRAHDHSTGATVGDGTFTDLVMRFGDSVPPKLALAAIDEILSQARKSDDKSAVTVGGSGGSATFNSNYDYQLFALLPLLRRLDESSANHLVEENAALKSAMNRFPDGMDSVSPVPAAAQDKDGPPPHRGGISFSTSNSSSKANTDEVVRQEMQRRADLILKQAETDPTQAIAQASALALTIAPWIPSPRATTLEAIARMNMKKQPAGARQALAELRKTIKDLAPRDQMSFISASADIYLQMGDTDKAEDVVSEGLSVAALLLESDLNAGNPNKALKAWWPSADAYRRMIEIETKISHPATAKLLESIKDPDLNTVESIMFARSLLGVPLKIFRVVEKNKNGNRVRMGDR